MMVRIRNQKMVREMEMNETGEFDEEELKWWEKGLTEFARKEAPKIRKELRKGHKLNVIDSILLQMARKRVGRWRQGKRGR